MATNNFEDWVERKCQAVYIGKELWPPETAGTALWLKDGLGWAFEPSDQDTEAMMVNEEDLSFEPDL